MTSTRSLIALSLAAFAAACASPETPTMASPMPEMVMSGAAMPMAAMDARTQAMHDMHHKMRDAQTPLQRQALMADHMAAMQGGMAKMNEMHGSKPGMGGMQGMQGMGDGKAMPPGMAQRHQMMSEHMATMQLMMDMMKQRMPATP